MTIVNTDSFEKSCSSEISNEITDQGRSNDEAYAFILRGESMIVRPKTCIRFIVTSFLRSKSDPVLSLSHISMDHIAHRARHMSYEWSVWPSTKPFLSFSSTRADTIRSHKTIRKSGWSECRCCKKELHKSTENSGGENDCAVKYLFLCQTSCLDIMHASDNSLFWERNQCAFFQ